MGTPSLWKGPQARRTRRNEQASFHTCTRLQPRRDVTSGGGKGEGSLGAPCKGPVGNDVAIVTRGWVDIAPPPPRTLRIALPGFHTHVRYHRHHVSQSQSQSHAAFAVSEPRRSMPQVAAEQRWHEPRRDSESGHRGEGAAGRARLQIHCAAIDGVVAIAAAATAAVARRVSR